MAKPRTTEENSTIYVDDLRRFAQILCGTGRVFESLAEWFEEQEISKIRGSGMPTARKGCGYLANFVATVLNAYHETLLDSGSKGVSPDVIVKGNEVRAAAKKIVSEDKGRAVAEDVARAGRDLKPKPRKR